MAYSAELYVHDLDRQAADALNQFPKFVKLLESYSANYDEKAAKIDLLSTAIRLGENQMPEVYGLLPPICEQLGIDTPELYYVRDKRANAATFGSVHPCIYVTSGLVNKLPLNLLPSVLAHECGHIACKHSLYHSIAAQLVGGIDRSPLVRIPAIGKYLTPALVRALLFWDRCSELSADRAAALCDGTADKTIDVLLRLNGYGKNVDRKEFLKQALDLKSFGIRETAKLKSISTHFSLLVSDTTPVSETFFSNSRVVKRVPFSTFITRSASEVFYLLATVSSHSIFPVLYLENCIRFQDITVSEPL